VDDLLRRALYASAGDLQALAAEVGVGGTYEADLRSSLRRALQIVIGMRGIGAEALAGEVRPEIALSLPDWPKVGKCDLAVRPMPDGSALAALELKWCRDPSDVYQCLWDAFKVGLALSVGRTNRAFIVAGMSATGWSVRPTGAELFGDTEVAAADLAGRYEKHWKWLLDGSGSRPVQLPRRICTRLTASVPIHAHEGDWEVRCAEVTVVDAVPTAFQDGWPVDSTS
jgi:hypothetical protein